jgi:hypothetical protein
MDLMVSLGLLVQIGGLTNETLEAEWLGMFVLLAAQHEGVDFIFYVIG